MRKECKERNRLSHTAVIRKSTFTVYCGDWFYQFGCTKKTPSACVCVCVCVCVFTKSNRWETKTHNEYRQYCLVGWSKGFNKREKQGKTRWTTVLFFLYFLACWDVSLRLLYCRLQHFQLPGFPRQGRRHDQIIHPLSGSMSSTWSQPQKK